MKVCDERGKLLGMMDVPDNGGAASFYRVEVWTEASAAVCDRSAEADLEPVGFDVLTLERKVYISDRGEREWVLYVRAADVPLLRRCPRFHPLRRRRGHLPLLTMKPGNDTEEFYAAIQRYQARPGLELRDLRRSRVGAATYHRL